MTLPTEKHFAGKRLTLTFDNGPDPECTPYVLDVLHERGIKATFFVCAQGNALHAAMSAGSLAGRRLLDRIRSDGHWIGNHTLTHTLELGTTNDPLIIEREIGENHRLLADYQAMRLFRPYMAGGLLGQSTFSKPALDYLETNGYTVVLFNSCPRDWENPDGWPEVGFADIARHDWTVMIVHDVSPFRSMTQLERFLDHAIAEGVQFEQSFPDDCVPIRVGIRTRSVEGLVCGSIPETPRELSTLAMQFINPFPSNDQIDRLERQVNGYPNAIT
jgi:peptidoglycan-N-acetylglucosamine deacetylase